MSAMPISELFGGGSGGGFYQQLMFTSSGSFTAPNDGFYLLSAIGGGASGGASGGRGGCAGGFSQKMARLKAGDVINYTIGAGGVGNGVAGGDTTLTAPGISLTANGGTQTTGGTASGGDTNVTGGVSRDTAGTGGGAVGVYGVTPPLTTSISRGGQGVGSPSEANNGGSALPNGSGSTGFGGGRILMPMGRGGSQISGSASVPAGQGEPGGGGGGGGSSSDPGGNGGMFAGGGGSVGTTAATAAGNGGIGAGGGAQQGTFTGRGGVGCVIIEFYRS